MELMDTHAHLCSSPLVEDLSGVIERAKQAQVTKILNICTDRSSLERGLSLGYPGIYHAAAVHPHDAEAEGEAFFPLVEQSAKGGNLIAIGETGLDYHYNHSKREIQQEYLRKHLSLAQQCGLPVIIHCREAFEDLFSILSAFPDVRGVVHCFTGTLTEAHQVLECGWHLSLSGIVTFKKSAELREVARIVPLNKLLIETDAPFLAPQGHRGKQNEPAYLVEIATVIAAVRGISLPELAEATRSNAHRLFMLS